MPLCYDESRNVGVNALVQNKQPNPMTEILVFTCTHTDDLWKEASQQSRKLRMISLMLAEKSFFFYTGMKI